MQQPVPMAHFMRRRAPEVIPVQIPAWHRLAEHVAPVEDVRAGRRGGGYPGRGQRAIAQQSGAGWDAWGACSGL